MSITPVGFVGNKRRIEPKRTFQLLNSPPTNCICQLQWRIQERGLGPPHPSHHLFLDQTEAPHPPPLISRYGSGTDLEILVIALLHCTFLLPVVSIQVYLVQV